MRIFFSILFITLNIAAFAQKPKKKSVQTYQHILPSQFFPAGYETYSAIYNLNGGEKKVYVDGEYIRNSENIIFNEFWKKEDVESRFAIIQFLKYEVDPNIKNANKLLINVDVSNARIDAVIKEDQDQDYPYTYEYSWSVDVTTIIQNSKSGDVLLEETETYGSIYLPSSNKKGFKKQFKTYKEAMAYVSEDADKNLIGNEFYKKMGYVETIRNSYEVRFSLQDPMPFWKISKEKKFPKAISLNKVIEKAVNEIKILNEVYPETIHNNARVKAKNLLSAGKALSFKVSNDTLGFGYRNKLAKIIENIAIESDKLIPELDITNKKEKGILWAMYMNKATAAYANARYNKSKILLEKAKELDYNKNRTGNLERAIEYASKSYDLLLSGKTKDGSKMNPKYHIFRTE